MKRINIRLPGTGPASVIATFNGNTGAHSEAPRRPDCDVQGCEPIAQQPLSPAVKECWLAPGTAQAREEGRFTVSRARDFQFASIELPACSSDMRQVTRDAYNELLTLTADSDYPQLVRFWNYVPDINAGEGDREIYRQFCWGRAEAFTIDELALPAATAIGSQDGVLRISLLSAGSAVTVRHLENPRQVSAYHYPRQYGPRSPSFARATEISLADQQMVFLSGTSSIVRHETQHPHNLCAQTAETQRNITELLATATNSEHLQAAQLRCYLRHPQDLSAAQAAYASAFQGYPEPAFVQGDICRSALLMEIDGVFSSPPLDTAASSAI